MHPRLTFRRCDLALAGEQHGHANGYEAGYELGKSKGLELGRELGQYRGRVAMLRVMCDAHSDFAPDRIRSTLARLEVLLASISFTEPRDEKCFDDFEDARAKMRMLDVWLHGPTGMARWVARRTAAAEDKPAGAASNGAEPVSRVSGAGLGVAEDAGGTASTLDLF